MNRLVWKLDNSEAGFTLIEILLATIIFTLVALAMGSTFMNGGQLVANATAKRRALTLAQSRMEDIKLASFIALTAARGTFPEDLTIDNVGFRRTLTVEYVTDADYRVPSATATNSIRLTVTVQDNDPNVVFDDVTLQTVVAS